MEKYQRRQLIAAANEIEALGYDNATEQQKPVVFLSAEMSNKQLTKRFLSMQSVTT